MLPTGQDTISEIGRVGPHRRVQRINRRQSRRLSLELPLEFRWRGSLQHAITALVNDGGALVLSPVPCPVQTRLVVRNVETGGEALFQVNWCWVDESQSGAMCRLGLMILTDGPRFWGASFIHAKETPVGRDS